MREDRLRRLIVAAVAAHSLTLGAAMLAAPARVLALVRWPHDGSLFFPAQSGVFLLILGLGYLAGMKSRPFAWFLVLSKAVAVLFLVGAAVAGEAPRIVLLQAAGDGLMGLAVALILWRTRAAVPVATLLMGAALGAFVPPARAQEGAALDAVSPLLIDDFARDDGVSALGTAWQRFTDRVMGGRSRAQSGVEVVDGRRCLRLTGEVSLANNGGFIQVALPLAPRGGALDASGWTGLRLQVRGRGDGYYLHLRTADCRLPWQHYAAPLPVGSDWTEVTVPFAAFTRQSLAAPLDTARLDRLGIVAAKQEFAADIAVARIELVR